MAVSSTALIVLIIEYGLVLILTLAVFEARRLRTNWHHFWIYSAYFTQLVIWAYWMARGVDYSRENIEASGASWVSIVLSAHIIFGFIVGIAATYLVAIYLINREMTVPRLKRTKPIMKFVYYGWVSNVLLGTVLFLGLYVL